MTELVRHSAESVVVQWLRRPVCGAGGWETEVRSLSDSMCFSFFYVLRYFHLLPRCYYKLKRGLLDSPTPKQQFPIQPCILMWKHTIQQ